MHNWHSEVIVITGASAGVGRATVQAFAKRGARIGLIARGLAGLEGAKKDAERLGGKGLVLPPDVAQADQVEAAAQKVEETFGPIDIWINAAMVSVFSPLKEMTFAEFHRVTEVTYLGTGYGTMAARRQHGLTFAPDPATHSHCAIGGMLGNNSCGIHSLLAGKHGFGLRTSDNTHELEVLTYDGARMRVGATSPEELERITRRGSARGAIYRQLRDLRDQYQDQLREHFPKLPRRVSGYNVDELLPEHDFHVARSLVGSEGTLVTILEATLHLVPQPAARTLLVLGYSDAFSAADHLSEILEFQPIGLEGIDETLIEWNRLKQKNLPNLKLMPQGHGWLFVLFGGDSRQDTDAQAQRCLAKLEKVKHPPSSKIYDDEEEEEKLWKTRESGLSATAWVPNHPDNWPGFEDSVVPVPAVGPYLRELRKLMDKYHYITSLY